MADVGWLSVSGELFGTGPVASRHSRYFPIARVIYSSLFPPCGHHLQRCGTKASCLFSGSAADCCRTSLGSSCAASSPSSTHPGTPVTHWRCYQCPQICRIPALLQAPQCFKAVLLKELCPIPLPSYSCPGPGIQIILPPSWVFPAPGTHLGNVLTQESSQALFSPRQIHRILA